MTTYNSAIPADTQTIAGAPTDIRANFEGLRTGRVVDAGTLKGLIPGNATGNVPVANGTVCTNLNAEKVGGNLPSAFATATHTHIVATTSSNGLMSNTDKVKLIGIATGAEVNQNAFSTVSAGGVSVVADSETDTLALIAGANITLTGDATNDAITIAVSGTVPLAISAGACSGNSATATTATTATTTTGNAGTATKLAASRTIALSGKITGTATSFDGSVNISIPVTTVTADSCTGNSATATTASNATTAGGLAVNSTGVNNIANQIMRTDASGYSKFGAINTNLEDTTAAATSYYVETGGDGYIRPKSLADVKAELGVASAFDAGHLFGGNGYQKLGNGLLLQWVTVANTVAYTQKISFPIAFPQAVFGVVVGTWATTVVSGFTQNPNVWGIDTTGFYRSDYNDIKKVTFLFIGN